MYKWSHNLRISIDSSQIVGRPQPEVRWMVNGVLVDDQYEHNTGDVIENRLLWPSVQRTDLNSIFTCQAINTQLVEPRENSYILDLHRKYFLLVHLLFPSTLIVYFTRRLHPTSIYTLIPWCLSNVYAASIQEASTNLTSLPLTKCPPYFYYYLTYLHIHDRFTWKNATKSC